MGGWLIAAVGAMALGPAIAQVAVGLPAARGPASQHGAAAPGDASAASPVPAQWPANAQPGESPNRGFEAYKRYLMQLARSAGVRDTTINAYVPTLRLNGRAIQLDRAQMPISSSRAIPSPLSPYLQRHVTPSLISRGQARYYSHWPQLVRIQARYGVDPAVLMAIYGKETSYGSVTGGFDLLDVLASLAYDGRRRPMFETEFLSALKLIDAGYTRAHLRGSYAGATGYPQFMPSVVLRLRSDGDGDGHADIWRNEVDALASIANYLREAGWKPGVAWGAAVQLPADFNRAAVKPTKEAARCPAVFRRHSRWLPAAEWRALGVTSLGRALPDAEMATLMELDGPGRTAYLLTANYRAILEYNCSNSYAMSIGLLADAIARR